LVKDSLGILKNMVTFNIITLFPEVFESFLQRLPFSRAIERQIIEVNLIQLRGYAVDKRGTVDGRPYSGGVGMILRIEPIWEALEDIYNQPIEKSLKQKGNYVAALTPSGKTFNQKKVLELSKKSTITLICGRYEGMDARIKENLVNENLSVGNFVLSGGEIPALTVMEAVTRLLPGAIEKEEATQKESFMGEGIEAPQYTRPEEYRGLRVPEVLLSGNHAEIEKWKKCQAKKTNINRS